MFSTPKREGANKRREDPHRRQSKKAATTTKQQQTTQSTCNSNPLFFFLPLFLSATIWFSSTNANLRFIARASITSSSFSVHSPICLPRFHVILTSSKTSWSVSSRPSLTPISVSLQPRLLVLRISFFFFLCLELLFSPLALIFASSNTKA